MAGMLAIGGGANMLVAWARVAWRNPATVKTRDLSDQEAQRRWSRIAPEELREAVVLRGSTLDEAFAGSMLAMRIKLAWPSEEDAWPSEEERILYGPEPAMWSVGEWRTGFPLQPVRTTSMYCMTCPERSQIEWKGCVRLPEGIGWLGIRPCFLPATPVLPEFLVGAVGYGAMAAAAIWGPGAIKRRRRRRSGRCLNCGYPLGGAAVCSECGTEPVEVPSNITV